MWAVGGTVILNVMVNRAKKKGEVFEYGPNDKRFEESDKLPNFWAEPAPAGFLFIIYKRAKVNINISLGLGALLTLVLNWKYLKPVGILTTINGGAMQAIAPMATVGAMVGFANVVTGTEAFGDITTALFGMDIPPVLLVIIFCGIIAGLTGGSGTGFLVSLPVLAPALLSQGVRSRDDSPRRPLRRYRDIHAALQRLHPHVPAHFRPQAQGHLRTGVLDDGRLGSREHGCRQ